MSYNTDERPRRIDPMKEDQKLHADCSFHLGSGERQLELPVEGFVDRAQIIEESGFKRSLSIKALVARRRAYRHENGDPDTASVIDC